MDTDAQNTKTGNATTTARAPQSSAGNFLRNDQSLVMRTVRSDRFTDKFRDGVVQRILNGSTTIADVRQQHHLTEQDVIAWMKDSFDRKQKRVDELKGQLNLAQSTDDDRIVKIESTPRRITIDGDVIDGRSQPKPFP
jgi:transposase-like protein